MDVYFQYQGLINQQYKKFFENQVPQGVNLTFLPKLSKDELAEQADKIEVLVGYNINKDFLEKATKLKHIQIPWTGFNNFGIVSQEELGDITIANSHSNSLAIAEHAVSLLFGAAKLLTRRDTEMRKGDWSSRYTDVDSVWMTGKTLGIIGYGAIGKKVAKMLKFGFDMKILGIKRSKSNKDELCDFLGTMDDIELVIQQSDFLLIGTPLTSETEDLINEKLFNLMKKNTVLVNIARGPIINEEALFNALKQKKIAAAGIDTWYNYPKGDERSIKQNFPFEELDNIVMTPHSAFKIKDRVEIFAEDILTNIIRIFEGKEPINQVNLDLGY